MMCSLERAFFSGALAVGLIALIVWCIRTGWIWGGRGAGCAVIYRSDDPFSLWTQIGFLATLVIVFGALTWRGVIMDNRDGLQAYCKSLAGPRVQGLHGGRIAA